MTEARSQDFASSDPSVDEEPEVLYDLGDFVEDPIGYGLFIAIRSGYQFPSADHAGDLTELQLRFLQRADIERQRRFLNAIAEMFSD